MNPNQEPSLPLLWDEVPCPLWVGTSEGKCIETNDALSKLLNTPKARLLGEGWMELLPHAERGPLLEILASRASKRKTFMSRLRVTTPSGVKSLSVRIRIRKDPSTDSKTILAAVTLARAERERPEPRLKEASLRMCFENAPIGIGYIDGELKFVHSNPALARLLTGKQSALDGMSLDELLDDKLPAISAAEIRRVCQDTLTHGTPHALRGWPLQSAASEREQRVTDWEVRRVVPHDTSEAGLLLTISDVTHQKLMQERLRLLASVLESTTDFVAVVSTEGNVLYLNRSARHTLGLTPDVSVHSLHISDLQPEDAMNTLREEGFPTAMREGAWEGETAFTSASGETIPVSQILVAHTNQSGEVEFLSTILRDITDALDIRRQLAAARERLEERVAERSAELAAATKLIREQVLQQAEAANLAKNAFLSRMSHELRTPLNAILGFAQLLKLETPTPGQLECVGHITRAGRHLLSLINEVLDIAHIETGRLALTIEPVDLNDFLHNCVEMMRPIAAKEKVDLQFVARDKAIHVRADRRRLKQVVLNFLSNAIKYNNEGGMVLVSLRLTPNGSRFEVRDTGPGIPLEKRNRLFMAFERLGAEASAIEGSGIGLALCKGLMDAMGGRIGLESPESGGCVFWAELPHAHAEELPKHKIETLPQALAPSVSQPSRPPITVLAIESQDLDLQLLERLIQKRYPECNLLTAMQGDIGLEFAMEHRPDVLILDSDLPDLSPNEFLSRLRTLSPAHTPRVVIVGTESSATELRSVSADLQTHILFKPYEPDELLALLQEKPYTQR